MAGTKEAVTTQRPYEKLVTELKQVAQLDTANGDGFEIAASVIDGIASAATIDDVFDANDSGPIKLKDSPYLGVPLSVYDVQFRKSDEKFKGGLGVYAIFNAFDDQGEQLLFSVGAPNVVSSLRKIQTLGGCTETKPTRLVINGRSTENGQLLTVGRPPAKK